jgi:hypothetical protein
MLERRRQQGVARLEVGVEAAVGQARFLHHLGHADAGIALAAHGARGGVEDALVRLFAAVCLVSAFMASACKYDGLHIMAVIFASQAPAEPMAALDVRFLDRYFDMHVMTPVQHAVSGALSGDPVKRADGMAHAEEKLALAYAWLETHLAGRTWAAGEDFTLADCAAAPSLFYADWTVRIGEQYPLLRAYRARLLARPSFARAVDEARPFRDYFPLGAPDRD